MRVFRLCALALAMCVSLANANETESPRSLSDLLRLVQQDAELADAASAGRLQRFTTDRDQRRAMLEAIEQELAAEERRSESLLARFDDNEQRLAALDERLEVRIGNFGELFGVVRQIAGDAKGAFDASIVSAQKPARSTLAGEIAQSRELPDIADLKSLQVLLLEEMIESSRTARFDTEFIDSDGVGTQGEVVRIGSFNLIHQDQFIDFQAETGDLQVLPRQPARRIRALAREFAEADSGTLAMAVDPTRGQLLRLLIQTPAIGERIRQGSYVGYVIIAMGVAGLLIALWRLIALQRVKRSVARQLEHGDTDESNPLGRILATYERNKDSALDALSLSLDEAIMRETPILERHQGLIKVFAALAPLLGLLGTVVGMILTFQQLTLFGTGDPKLMAGGISQALMTTVLGLIVAIPLILLHSLVAGASRSLQETLEEQSVGLIARRANDV